MKPEAILETVLYAENLNAARQFYEGVLGLECFAGEEGRDVFFRCGNQVLLIFNPEKTSIKRDLKPGVPPPHGAKGPGHVCFRASDGEINAWRERFEASGVEIESDFRWEGSNGRSLYVRDPAGNCVEFGEPKIWGFKD
jgi:catechol 2,3-dioxygenase-like lactoylglutathione lyase family enzyme